MKILLDECTPAILKRRLGGFEIITVHRESPEIVPGED